MGKRQQRTVGAIVEIPIDGQYYCYAQILDQGLVFFDYKSKTNLKDLSILLNTPVLFFIEVYSDVITKGLWLKVGKLKIKDEFEIVPMQFIQDHLKPENFELYNPNTGEITPSTKEECKGLEAAAVWEANHVEERLRDHYAGKPNIWVERMKIV